MGFTACGAVVLLLNGPRSRANQTEVPMPAQQPAEMAIAEAIT